MEQLHVEPLLERISPDCCTRLRGLASVVIDTAQELGWTQQEAESEFDRLRDTNCRGVRLVFEEDAVPCSVSSKDMRLR